MRYSANRQMGLTPKANAKTLNKYSAQGAVLEICVVNNLQLLPQQSAA